MFSLPPLPYSLDGLEPYMGRRALDLHYNVLHRGYVQKVNDLTPPNWIASDLLDVIGRAEQEKRVLLSRAALQAWNHEFFWASMRPPTPTASEAWGPLRPLVKRYFGSTAKLRSAFIEEGVQRFASGWVWLCLSKDKQLFVESTPNADNPMLRDRYPLLVCDVWEHAYYPDYGPDRKHYLATWFDKLADMDFAAQNTRRVLQVLAR